MFHYATVIYYLHLVLQVLCPTQYVIFSIKYLLLCSLISTLAPYAIIFMAHLEEGFGGGILTIYIFFWERGEDSLKQFIEILTAFHLTIKFTAEWSK